MRIIDTHAHLNDERLYSSVSDIVSNMESDGLSKIINVGYCQQSSETSVKLANTYKSIYCSVGIHPHDASNAHTSNYDYFSSVATNPKLVAIGEIGLDYYYNHSERAVQKRVFVEQLELASALKLPVIIHLRDAFEDMLKLLKTNLHYLNNGLVLHCFSGDSDMVHQFLNIYPVYFSVGGAITFKNNLDKKDVLSHIPIDSLLLETDCPYMTPVPFRGTTNYPKYINFVASKLQEWFPERNIISETNANALRLFTKLNN
ncbi:MAG: TatD family hydrolase [Christensenellaceae bacterium]|jgi:TatD DNase family protein|nr:TatD family hydrolase [Christensenellaceae bacterium]